MCSRNLFSLQIGGQAKSSFVNSGTGIRVCRWSPDGMKIATAGDDEKTTLWDIETMEQLQYVLIIGIRMQIDVGEVVMSRI